MRTLAPLLLVACLVLQAGLAMAHHGWAWTTGGNIDLTGVVTEVDLGLPHGVIKVDVEGEVWTVEVGQPWRNERAGLKEGELVEGVEIRAIGEPALDADEKRMKAEKFYIGGREFNLYPGRD